MITLHRKVICIIQQFPGFVKVQNSQISIVLREPSAVATPAPSARTSNLHELAERLDALNDSVAGDSRVVSLVSSCIEPDAAGSASVDAASRRTYRMVKSRPMGRSYALELARQYGISLDQLKETLRGRGLLSPAPGGPAATET